MPIISNMRLSIFGVFFVLSSALFASDYICRSEIEEIYESYINPENIKLFENRYVRLNLSEKEQRFWKDKDFPRLFSTLEFGRYVKNNPFRIEKALVINGRNDPELEYIDCEQIININYPDNPEKFDLHLIDYPDKDFDFVMLNQTLEHVYNPIQCLENIGKHMKSGGILFINVPTINKLHEVPYNYYTGITPVGLGVILRSAQFDILHIGQWGNRTYLKKLFTQKTWPSLRDMKREEKSGFNEFDFPVITWAFARKR
jgi:SAM-dependent methyltransferase